MGNMSYLYTNKITEIVPQTSGNDVLIMSGNSGLLVPDSYGIKVGDVVSYYGSAIGQPIQAIQVENPIRPMQYLV